MSELSEHQAMRDAVREIVGELTDDHGIEHVDGVPWWDAPIPRRLHRCRVQTRGWLNFTLVERCACGAVRMPDRWGGWAQRNSR